MINLLSRKTENTVQKDAGKILEFLYKEQKAKGVLPKIDEVLKNSGYGDNRVIMAVEFLESAEMIEAKIIKLASADKIIIIRKITEKGIRTVENGKEFRRHFNIGINLVILSVNWGATEK